MAPSNTFGGYALWNSSGVRRHRLQYRYDEVPELKHANSLYVAHGLYPARGWLLLRREDYDKLNKYTSYNLVIQDFGKKTNPDNPITLKHLWIVQARCVTRGIASDKNAIYLVEVTDARGLVWNRWFKFPTQSQYNIRAPAYPEQWYAASLNSGTPWTWNGLIGDLWGQMAAYLGSWPGLGVTPSWTPEGWSFPGVSAWEAVNRMLTYLGLTVTVDLTQAAGSQYGIAVLGAKGGNAGRFATYSGVIEDDWEYIDTGQARVPQSVVVLFHRRNQYFGTEETVRNDFLQWSSTPAYSVTVTGSYPSATGTHYLWSDFTVRYDTDGLPLDADVITASTIAASVVQNYYNLITSSTNGFMQRQYIGALPFTVDGQVDGVCWREDHRPEEEVRLYKGWVTQIVSGREPPFEEVRQ